MRENQLRNSVARQVADVRPRGKGSGLQNNHSFIVVLSVIVPNFIGFRYCVCISRAAQVGKAKAPAEGVLELDRPSRLPHIARMSRMERLRLGEQINRFRHAFFYH